MAGGWEVRNTKEKPKEAEFPRWLRDNQHPSLPTLATKPARGRAVEDVQDLVKPRRGLPAWGMSTLGPQHCGEERLLSMPLTTTSFSEVFVMN